MTQFRTCGKCSLYSYSLLRCTNGKANPRTLKDTKNAMSVMGSSYICPYSKWKEKALQQLSKELKSNITLADGQI